MRIKNHTNLNTRQLAALIRETARRELLTQGKINELRVTIKYRKNTHARPDNHPGGYAYYGSSIFCLSFVKGVKPSPVGTAKTIAHELAHCQGVHHGKAMRGAQYGWEHGWEEIYGWAKDYPLEILQGPVAPTKEQKTEENLQKCQKMVDAWERKVKMAENKVKKWKAKLRYFDKRLAAMTSKPAQEPVNVLKEGDQTNGNDA